MTIKKSTIFFSVFFIVSFIFTFQILGEPLPQGVNDLPNHSNIHTKKNPNFQENFSQAVNAPIAEQIELLKKKKAELLAQQNLTKSLSPEEIFFLKVYASTIEQQIIDQEAKAKTLPTLDAQRNLDDCGENIAQNHWTAADIIAYARASKRAARKALLDKLIQTNRTLQTNVRRLRSYVYTPKAQLQTVPVIATADSVFALAAGAAVAAEIVVTGVTIATGMYAGSNHDSNNSSVLQAPAAQVPTPNANTPAAVPPANAPRANASCANTGTIHLSSTPTHAHNVNVHSAKKTNPNVTTSKPKTITPDTASTRPTVDSQQTPKESFKKDPVFSPSDNVQTEAVKRFEVQKAHDRVKRDHVINTAAATVVVGLQQYDQCQKQMRKAKKIAGWAQEKEEDIQKRMRAGGKSRWQIEEEDRLFFAKCEQSRIEQAHIEKVKQQEKKHEEVRKKEEKKKKKLEKKSNKQKQNGVNRTSNFGPGQDPDDEDKSAKKSRGIQQKDLQSEKKFFTSLKENAKETAFHNRFKKFYKDPTTNMWWSKDIDHHGHSMYKVFKEGSAGLEWLFDADALGQKILDKHKGPTGRFIPYKELIFYS